MSKKVELYQKYVKLVQLGRKEDAQKVLEQVWALSGKKQAAQEPIVKDKVEEKPKEIVVKPKKEMQIKDLVKIKGVGVKTIKDLQKLYSSIEELKSALQKDLVPLRDDVVEKLKKEVLLNGSNN